MNRKRFLQYLAAGGTGLALGPMFGRTTSVSANVSPIEQLPLHNWAEVRKLFPLRHDFTYLNTGGLGPPSRPVIDAMQAQTLLQAEAGEHHHFMLEANRRIAADFIGANASEIAFTRNASEANSLVAAGLDLKAGDEIILESHAHPGGSFPWLNRQKLDGVKVRVFEPDPSSPAGNLDRLFSLVNERTRVVQVSHVTAPTGLLFDAEAIARECRRRGIWFHVDAAQSVGMIPIDVHRMQCDSLGTSGHKWLNGPQESGLLYIAGNRLDDVAGSHVGAHSNEDYELPGTFSYRASAVRHEYGTRDVASVIGLTTAMELQKAIGRDRIAAHGRKLVHLTREALTKINGIEVLTPEREDMHGSMITFRAKDRPNRDINTPLLEVYNLRCRPVDEAGLNGIRVSWHVYHQKQDVARLVESIESVLKA